MNTSGRVPRLHFDAAQSQVNRDEFGFKDLAANVASSVASLLADATQGGSFVVGLEGKWGSGKSTILNYVRAALADQIDQNRQFLVDFDPWWLEEGANISASLLGDVLSTLPQKDAKAAAKAVGRLAIAVSKMPDGVEAVLKLSKRTEALAEVVAAMKQAGGDVNNVLNASKPARRLRQDVAEAFKEGGFQFVVFIDDLDRLTPQQALQVMGAIRSIADLPGFVYVLAYDPRALENILKSSTPPLGHDYLEKIVNVSVPVPPITFAQMEAFTAKLLAQPLWLEIARPDRDRHKQALISLLDAPRDALRFANASNFWIGNKTAEVFVPDFLVLEAIRLAKPSVYEGLLRTADIWLDRPDDNVISRILGSGANQAPLIDEKRLTVNAELGLGAGQRDQVIRRALAVLFPKAAPILGQDAIFTSEKPDAQSISVSDHFFTYFLHKPVIGAATKLEVDELVSERTTQDRRVALVSTISARLPGDVTPLRHLIAMVDARIERAEIRPEIALKVARAFASPRVALAPSQGSPHDSDLFAVRGLIARTLKYVERVTDKEVEELAGGDLTIGMITLLHVTITAGTEHYLLRPQGDDRLVVASDDALSALTARFVEQALAAIKDGSIYNIPIAPWPFFMCHKAQPQKLAQAMSLILADPRRLIEFVESHRGYENPVSDMSAFCGLSPAELKERVEQGLVDIGLTADEWPPWRWFRS